MESLYLHQISMYKIFWRPMQLNILIFLVYIILSFISSLLFCRCSFFIIFCQYFLFLSRFYFDFLVFFVPWFLYPFHPLLEIFRVCTYAVFLYLFLFCLCLYFRFFFITLYSVVYYILNNSIIFTKYHYFMLSVSPIFF